MKWLRLLVLFCLAVVAVTALVLAALLGPFRPRALAFVRAELEAVLVDALRVPVSIGALRVSLVPLHAEADGIAIGGDGALARVDHLTASVDVRASLRAMQPIAAATADGVMIDVPGWAALPPRPATPSRPMPRFTLESLAVRSLRARLADQPEAVDAAADELNGMLSADTLGHLHFAAVATAVVVTRADKALPISRASVAGDETATGYYLTAVDVAGDGLQLSGITHPPSPDLTVRAALDLTRLAWVNDSLRDIAGQAELNGSLAGPLQKPRVAGTVKTSALAFDGEAIGDLVSQLEVTPEQVVIRSARLSGPAGEAEASGDLRLQGVQAYDVTVRWSSLDVRRLARLEDSALKPFTADGDVGVHGTLNPLTAQGQGTGRIVPTDAGTPIEWRGRTDYRAGGGDGQIEATQGTANTVRAQLRIGADRAMSGTVDVAVADTGALGAVLPIGDLPNLRGVLNTSARIAGRVDDPQITGDVSGRSLALLGVGIDRITGSFAADRSAVHIAAFRADLQPGTISAAGTIALGPTLVNDFLAHAERITGDTVVAVVFGLSGTVPPIGRGTVTADVRGRGPWSRLELQANATIEQFWLSQEWIQQGTIDARATWPQWSANAELRNRAAQTVTLRASGTGIDDVTAQAHAAGWQLTSLQRGDAAETHGTVTLDAAVRGPARALNGTVHLQMLDLIWSGRRFGTIDVGLDGTRGRWQLHASALDDTIHLRGTVSGDAGWPFSVDAEWRDARLGQIVRPGADVWIVTSGTAQANGRLSAIAGAEASADVAALRLANGPYQLDLVAPAHLRCARGSCTLDRLELRGANTDAQLTALVASNGTVRVTLQGGGDLRLLELAGAPIESARGRFTVNADVRRSAGHWALEGQVQLADVGLDVGAPVVITRATGQLTLIGTMLRIDQLGGRIGTGSFAVAGAIDLQRGPQITWTLTDVGADLMPSLEAELSGRGDVEGTWDHVRIAGDIHVARMLYDRNIELLDLLPSFNRALAAAPRPPSPHPIELDIHIVAPGELYVENNLARIEAAADLRITGTAAHPVLSGRVEGLDGEVTFRDRVFELQSATIDFRPDLGLTPALNITVESTIDTPDATYTVGVRVTGTTAAPRIALSSDDPALSQTDIATLIAVGKTTAQLREGGGGGFSMYDALAIVPNQLASPLTQRARRLLPIDRISFEPTFSRTTGTFEPQLKLGKDLTDNLAVAVGQTFGVESRTIAEADYRLSPHVFIPLSWESQTATQQGAFAAGFKLRYEFWRITPYTLLRTLRR